MTMRTLTRGVLLAALCAALGTAARADGDVPSGAPYTWSGLYVGAHLGGGADLSGISDSAGPSMFGSPDIGPITMAGLQIGYNLQSGAVVYGLEADLALPYSSGTATCSALSGSFINSTCRVGVDTLGTIAGRLGLAVGDDGRGLIYGKAGAAWSTGNIDIATNDATMGAGGNPFSTSAQSLDRWGWMLGAGAEYAMTGNWSVKAEYDYADFGDQSLTLLPSAIMTPAGAVAAPVPARAGEISQELHLFKVGLNYRFGDQVVTASEAAAAVAAAPGLNGFSFDVGGRYWYSWGRHKYDLGLVKGTAAPYSQISRLTYGGMDGSTGEAFGRITAPLSLFAKGFIGGGNVQGGKLNDEDFGISGPTPGSLVPYTNTLSSASGDIPLYGTVDVGYDLWRATDYRFGVYVGYNYYKEEMGAHGCQQTANPIGPCSAAEGGPIASTGHAIITQDARWQSLRLGAATEFYLAPRFKVSADAAYLPYVVVDAVDHHFLGNTPAVASVNPLTGYGKGAQLEAMLAYDLTPNISLGVGARYWAMWSETGSFRRTYDSSAAANPQIHQSLKIETDRVGVLGELTYTFD
jgi:opacity protein-like surface antigen